jgi:hypothetical protein
VIATTSFASAAAKALVGRHPEVISPGVIRQGTRLYDDDPIVLAHPTRFIDASLLPEPYGPAGRVESPGGNRPSAREWRMVVIAHRKTSQARPKLLTVAGNMDWQSEQPLRDLIHRLGFRRWYDVHAAVAAEPE